MCEKTFGHLLSNRTMLVTELKRLHYNRNKTTEEMIRLMEEVSDKKSSQDIQDISATKPTTERPQYNLSVKNPVIAESSRKLRSSGIALAWGASPR